MFPVNLFCNKSKEVNILVDQGGHGQSWSMHFAPHLAICKQKLIERITQHMMDKMNGKDVSVG